jgi:hypothetical protein
MNKDLNAAQSASQVGPDAWPIAYVAREFRAIVGSPDMNYDEKVGYIVASTNVPLATNTPSFWTIADTLVFARRVVSGEI